MDKQTITNLIEQAKKGSRKAMGQLLVFAHTPVYFLCIRLLNDPHTAEDMTQKILKTLPGQIGKIENADHFHKWLGNMTASLCMKRREQMEIREYTPESQNMSFPSNELSREESAQVVLLLADSLPEKSRICLLLSVCGRVGTKAIAQMTGFSDAAVVKYIADAQLAIQEQMQLYQNQGVVFTGGLSAAGLLRDAMYGSVDRDAAVAMVKRILPPVAPAPSAVPVQAKKQRKNPVILLLCMAVALVFLLALMVGGVMMDKYTHNAGETTFPSSAATTSVTESTQITTSATTAAATEPTTEPTTEPAAEETTVPETAQTEETAAAPEIPETTAPKTSYKPVTNTGNTTGSPAPKPTTDPNYNPGQGEDGHTHDFFSVPAAQRATCTRYGQMHRLCRICNRGVTVDNPDEPPLGHNYQVNLVVAPTTSGRGYTIYKCTRCSDSYDADFVDPLPAPETQPPVVETQPPVIETQPPVIETQPPVIETQPPVSDSGDAGAE